uniref:Mitochondrial import inner membrane translocase subunit TIM14 n=1 Tax=Monodon monoceros TaxID=40151 RepID=A0A8C6BBB1_MONMO
MVAGTSTAVTAGLTIAAAGFAGRYALQAMKHYGASSKTNGGYYRGGFEPQMTKWEAALILGVSPTANKGKIRGAHRRIMLLNHPEKGGSPYITSPVPSTCRKSSLFAQLCAPCRVSSAWRAGLLASTLRLPPSVYPTPLGKASLQAQILPSAP